MITVRLSHEMLNEFVRMWQHPNCHTEIPVETGFWDQSHFTKTFKHERGVTPGEYRRRHRTQAMS